MAIKLFVTDFDGTLLTDERTISKADIRTLERLRQQGIITAVATGRSMYSFEKALETLGMDRGRNQLPVSYIIFSTGAGIMDFPGRDILCSTSIPASGIGEITQYFDEKKMDYMVHKAVPETHHFFYKSHGKANPDFQSRIDLYGRYAVPLACGRTFTEPATEVLAVVRGGLDNSGVASIKKALSGFSVVHATSPLDHASSWIEVFHRDVSKSRAVAWLADRLGVSRRQVVSVGNDYNDQDLLEWSAKGYITANAPSDLQQVFPVVPSNNESGVTRAVRETGWMD